MTQGIDTTEITEGLCGDCTPPAKSHLVGSTVNGAVIGTVVFGAIGAAIAALTGVDVSDGALYSGAGGAVLGGAAGFSNGMHKTNKEHQRLVSQRMQQSPGSPVNWNLRLQEATTRITRERVLEEQTAAQSALVTELAQEFIGI